MTKTLLALLLSAMSTCNSCANATISQIQTEPQVDSVFVLQNENCKFDNYNFTIKDYNAWLPYAKEITYESEILKQYGDYEDICIFETYEYEDVYNELILRNQNSKIFVERIIGVVDDNYGNGTVLLNYANGIPAYINYKGWINAEKGDVIMTLCVYDPTTKYEDDIEYRHDFILGKLGEEK